MIENALVKAGAFFIPGVFKVKTLAFWDSEIISDIGFERYESQPEFKSINNQQLTILNLNNFSGYADRNFFGSLAFDRNPDRGMNFLQFGFGETFLF